MFKFVFLLLIFQSINLFALPGDVVTAKQWQSQYWKEFRVEMCNKEGYFNKCVEYKKGDCASNLQNHYFECLKKIRFEKFVKINTKGLEYSRKIASCTANHIAKNNKLLKDPICKKRDLIK